MPELYGLNKWLNGSYLHKSKLVMLV